MSNICPVNLHFLFDVFSLLLRADNDRDPVQQLLAEMESLVDAEAWKVQA